MKKALLLLAVFTVTSIYSQDIILKKNGESINSKIDEIGIDNIKYHKYNNLSGPTYVISNNDVSKITFENGDIEVLNVMNNYDIEKVKKIIVDNINEFGFERKSFDRNYKASFYGDYLWIKVYVSNKRNSTDYKDAFGLRYSEIYDFSVVYKFDGISKRDNGLAFINIYVPMLKSSKKDFVQENGEKNWEKNKLVIRVKGHKNADNLMNAFRDYNRLLNESI